MKQLEVTYSIAIKELILAIFQSGKIDKLLNKPLIEGGMYKYMRSKK
jgi:hypothetical protein